MLCHSEATTLHPAPAMPKAKQWQVAVGVAIRVHVADTKFMQPIVLLMLPRHCKKLRCSNEGAPPALCSYAIRKNYIMELKTSRITSSLALGANSTPPSPGLSCFKRDGCKPHSTCGHKKSSLCSLLAFFFIRALKRNILKPSAPLLCKITGACPASEWQGCLLDLRHQLPQCLGQNGYKASKA